VIRAADVTDLDALYDHEGLCFAERRFRKEHILWILKNPRAATFVCENGGVVASLMLLHERDLTRVLSVGVHPRHRRGGIGRELMAIAEDAALRSNRGEVRLEVNTKNEGAIAFYEALGYEVLGRLPRYYSWGDDAFAMAKPVALAVRKP
jgi:ribosomal protein S18 acetylase RimI-like enzyme